MDKIWDEDISIDNQNKIVIEFGNEDLLDTTIGDVVN